MDDQVEEALSRLVAGWPDASIDLAELVPVMAETARDLEALYKHAQDKHVSRAARDGARAAESAARAVGRLYRSIESIVDRAGKD